MANSDYISTLKQKIKNEIICDPLIVKAFGSPNYDPDDLDFSGEDVSENYIFTWGQNPETIVETITFMTIQVHTQKYNDKWVIPRLEIAIFSHEDKMRLNPKDFPGIIANRNDYLSQLLDKKFNGRTKLGTENDLNKINLVNELYLDTNVEGAYKDFPYRRMVFKTKDINNSFCNRW